jgi:hypothetical protein
MRDPLHHSIVYNGRARHGPHREVRAMTYARQSLVSLNDTLTAIDIDAQGGNE